MIVVAATSPPLHLARIHRLDLLHAVVGRVIAPRTVWRELVQAGTRPAVVAAIEAANWIEVVDDPVGDDLGLDPGETAAILLAEKLHADALLIDGRSLLTVATSLKLFMDIALNTVAAFEPTRSSIAGETLRPSGRR